MDGIEDIGPGPDLESIDTSKMDFGNDFGDDADASDDEKADKVDAVEKEESKEESKDDAKDGDDKDESKDDESKDDESKGDDDKEDDDGEEGEGQARTKDGKFAKKDKGNSIPKARFDEAVNKEREARENAEARARDLEKRLRELSSEDRERVEAGAQVEALETKAAELTTKYSELLLDGQKDEAAKVMAELRKTERSIAAIESERKTGQIVNQRLESERTMLVVAKLESDHPQFNPDSEQYDDDLVQMVLMFQARYVQQDKLSQSAAMEKAANAVLKKFNMLPVQEDDKKQPEETVKPDLAAEKAAKRTKEAISKAVDASKKQPSTMKDVGLDSDALGEKRLPDVSKMSAEEYDALPESTKARLRGDML